MRPGSIAGGFLLSTVEVSLYSSILVHPTVTYGLALCLVLVHRTRLFSVIVRFCCLLLHPCSMAAAKLTSTASVNDHKTRTWCELPQDADLARFYNPEN